MNEKPQEETIVVVSENDVDEQFDQTAGVDLSGAYAWIHAANNARRQQAMLEAYRHFTRAGRPVPTEMPADGRLKKAPRRKK